MLADMFTDDDETIKERGISPDDAAIDENYKICGMFALRRGVVPIDVYDGDRQIFAQNEQYMGIHVRELEQSEATPVYLRESLREVAAYLVEQQVAVDERLAGITYARLAQTAQAVGFEVSPLPIMAEPVANPAIEPVIVHQRVGDFIEMY